MAVARAASWTESSSHHRSRCRWALIVAAGLFLRSLGNLWAQETGYDRHNVLMFSVDAKLAGHDDAKGVRTYQRLLDELRHIPGTQSVSLSTVRPVTETYYLASSVTAVGDEVLPEGQGIRIAFNNVAPGCFATVRIPLLAGRDFEDRDGVDTPAVAIISERMARHFTGNPIGQRIGLGDDMREVVGVAKDIRHANVKDAPREVVYLPAFQEESLSYTPSFAIRHAGPAANMLGPVREAVTRTDAGLTPFDVKTLEVQTAESFSRERLLAMLTSFVGGFALLLASIGIYGLMSYSVTQRTPELGVRMALGATPAAVRRLIVSNSTAIVLLGALLGFVGSLVLGRLVQSQLYGLDSYDATTFAWATSLLLAVAFGAAYIPAVRASRIDPLRALRHD
ncbi:MAG: FtsX-like permease family protein [Luteitalea sp.]|nr:FtsX-like permease family protein [Luteitalea sp.]